MNKISSRSRAINKLALVLLSIVILELILIGDQVQPVKAIKKKIFMKKLKKLLPILALVKPKKKIILLPIPVPMFKNNGLNEPASNGYQPIYPNQNGRPMVFDGASTIPMSFVMMGGGAPISRPMTPPIGMGGVLEGPFIAEPALVGVGPMNPSARIPASMTMLPMTMTGSNSIDPMLTLVNAVRSNQNNNTMMPTVTMTIQSEPGANSAIELSTNMISGVTGRSNETMSANLVQRPISFGSVNGKWHGMSAAPQPLQQDQLFNDHFDYNNEANNQDGLGGEQYYSWPSNQRQPLISPAKVFRSERLRQQAPPPTPRPVISTTTTTTTTAPTTTQPPPATTSTSSPTTPIPTPAQTQQTFSRPAHLKQQQQQHNVAALPILVIKNQQWRPAQLQQQQQHRQQQQQQQPQFEIEELIPIGPPQMMPVYQTPNGQLHMSPPPPPSQEEPPTFGEQEGDGRPNSPEQGNEQVQTVGHTRPPARRPRVPRMDNSYGAGMDSSMMNFDAIMMDTKEYGAGSQDSGHQMMAQMGFGMPSGGGGGGDSGNHGASNGQMYQQQAQESSGY